MELISATSCQFIMGDGTPGKIENGKPDKLKMGAAPALIVLLLLSQFPLAAANFSPQLILEINYVSFESSAPENYSPDADPLDLQPHSAILLAGDESGPDKINWLPPGSNGRVAIHAIRAPPSLLT